jgi:hypothetical protein
LAILIHFCIFFAEKSLFYDEIFLADQRMIILNIVSHQSIMHIQPI